MQIEGSIISNPEAALASATRLRGQSVYKDTLLFRRDLLTLARAIYRAGGVEEGEKLGILISEFQREVTARD